MSRAQRERSRGAVPAGTAGTRPIVAIIGRPNVGKSTLFNRLAGARIAIVEDEPGITRDRHYADAFSHGREYVIVDTGGFDPESDDPLRASIARQVHLALAEADVVVCVLDATSPPVGADREAVKLLRGAKKPVVYVANKADTKRHALEAMELYELGVNDILAVSALHGNGIGELEAAIVAGLPPMRADEPSGWAELPHVAIVGRPNAGKSSMINRLLGEERQTVDARPGTTMDSIDAIYERGERRLVLIDTAGIRRRRSVSEPAEAVSVMQAMRSMERADVVVHMIDAAEGVSEQDAKIAGMAEERGRAFVIALNKCDLLRDDEQKKAETRVREVLSFVPWAPLVRVSAAKGRGVGKLLETIDRVTAAYSKRVTTGEINRFFETVLDKHPPPTMRGRSVRLYYVTQAQTKPPKFVAVPIEPKYVHFSYRRYVANQIREKFGFEGIPLRVVYRKKRRRETPEQ